MSRLFAQGDFMSKDKEFYRKKLAQIRQDAAKEYKDKIALLQEENKHLSEGLNAAKEEITRLNSLVLQYEKVVSQLQEIGNMTDEERNALVENLEKKAKLQEELDKLDTMRGLVKGEDDA